MTWYGVGFLCRIDGTLNSELYQSILKEELIKTLKWYNLEKSDIIFQQDNSTVHTSKSTQEWIQKNNLTVFQWPAQSPDMNPIEYLWNELKRRVKNSSKSITSVQSLWDIIQEEWEKIPTEFCQKLIFSMNE